MRYPEAESSFIEFKQALPKNNQIIKTVIGLCNTHGGKIIIGVADDRRIVGLSDQEIEECMEIIDQSIFNACSPNIVPRLYAQRFNDKTILIIEVSEGMNKPYYQRSEGVEKGTYIRLGRHTVHANPEMIQELSWQSSGIDFERLPVFQATMEDINEPEVKTFLANRKNQGEGALDEAMLKSYNIITYDQTRKHPSTLGILLFGKNPQHYFSEAMIICTHFRGNEGREAIAAVDCEGTLFNQFNQAFAFITHRLYRSFKIEGIKRKEKLEIPEVAIREALLNMIVHRNYHLKSPSKIAIYDDRVEFFSPGPFPGLISSDNLLSGITYLRNPAICKVLREANYIEKLGSGIIAIFENYEKTKLEKPQIINGENFVKCILPRNTKQTLDSEPLDDEAKIIKLLQVNKEAGIQDIMQHLSLSRSTITRKLKTMIQSGKVVRKGNTKNSRYQLR